MAEIKIQPKQQSGKWWLWVLPLVLLGFAAWFLMRGRGDEQVGAASDTAASSTGTGVGGGTGTMPATSAMSSGAVGGATGGSAVTEFASFIAAADTSRDESGQHQYTAKGIRRLAAAIEGSQAGSGAGAQITLMRAMADSLQQAPSGSDRHAEMARGAFDAAIIPLATLSGNAAPRLQSAARAISPERHLVAQKAAIQRFFESARDALQTGAADRSGVP
jgi:hypothetical protein